MTDRIYWILLILILLAVLAWPVDAQVGGFAEPWPAELLEDPLAEDVFEGTDWASEVVGMMRAASADRLELIIERARADRLQETADDQAEDIAWMEPYMRALERRPSWWAVVGAALAGALAAVVALGVWAMRGGGTMSGHTPGPGLGIATLNGYRAAIAVAEPRP